MSLTPSERAANALLRWPTDRPLVALVSGEGGGAWTQRSILAQPQETRVLRVPPGIGDARAAVERELRGILRRTGRSDGSSHTGPHTGRHTGWIVALSYDIGRALEPKARATPGATDDRDWPLAMLCWCPDALVLDHATGRWTVEGDPHNVPLSPMDANTPADASAFRVGRLRADVDRRAFESAVERCVQLIHDGDLFQANVARRMTADFSGSTRTLAARALIASGAWFGAYLECENGRTIVSMSPELFLSLDQLSAGASRRLVTRPVKGTLTSDADASALRDSTKDEAELAMIVDLMRNDLGRVCSIGSIRVDTPRVIETHTTVHHGVAEVSGTLRDGVDAVELLSATFPPGSVTGAPKIRAMQVIDELEPVRRGPYCGAIGIIASDGSIALNVAIRTIAISGRSDPRVPGELDGVLDYWAGCGIVADSRPAAEWDESVAKSEVLFRTLTPQRDLIVQRDLPANGRVARVLGAEGPAAT
ncbi:MAG: anthranilate synthase component I family protein [Phycisphaerae bacterium]|nr:anthranilate synthase component I family protein [Phycisphaerae bacterium]